MQITLNQDEILDAIKSYVNNQLTIRDDQEIAVDLKAGRGENGFTATLDVRASTVANSTPVQKPFNPSGSAKSSRSMPKAPADTEQSTEQEINSVTAQATATTAAQEATSSEQEATVSSDAAVAQTDNEAISALPAEEPASQDQASDKPESKKGSIFSFSDTKAKNSSSA